MRLIAGYDNYNERDLACLGGPVLTLGIFALACGSELKLTDSAASNQSGESQSDNGGLQPLNGEILFSVSERPWDLAMHPDGSVFAVLKPVGSSTVGHQNPKKLKRFLDF